MVARDRRMFALFGSFSAECISGLRKIKEIGSEVLHSRQPGFKVSDWLLDRFNLSSELTLLNGFLRF